MREWMIGFGIGAMLLATPSTTETQAVVKTKPVRPKMIVIKSQQVKKRHVWRNGHWKWEAKTKSFLRIKAGWFRPKRDAIWVQGHWKKVPGGWNWVDGTWRRV